MQSPVAKSHPTTFLQPPIVAGHLDTAPQQPNALHEPIWQRLKPQSVTVTHCGSFTQALASHVSVVQELPSLQCRAVIHSTQRPAATLQKGVAGVSAQ
jgi:hypothetical protein